MTLPSLTSRRPDPGVPLRQQVCDTAENRPGIYRFVGARGELLYVGKSVRIRTRLLSYFRAREGKPLELARVARGVEWEYVPNEFEALLREFRLIRTFRPRYNVQHRRRRRFAWVKLTAERAPRLVATARPAADGHPAFGPIPASRALARAVRDLAHVAGLRDCPGRTPIHFEDQLDLLGPERSPLCARHELGSCPAPCAARCSEGEYRARVSAALAFLQGRDDALLEGLAGRMREAAENRAFELAATHRDREARVRRLRDLLLEFGEHLRSLSFVYRVASDHGPARAYLVKEGQVRMSFDDPLAAAAGDGGPPSPRRKRLAEALRAAAEVPAPSPRELTEGAREELFLVARWFRRQPDERARTVPPRDYLDGLAAAGGT